MQIGRNSAMWWNNKKLRGGRELMAKTCRNLKCSRTGRKNLRKFEAKQRKTSKKRKKTIWWGDFVIKFGKVDKIAKSALALRGEFRRGAETEKYFIERRKRIDKNAKKSTWKPQRGWE